MRRMRTAIPDTGDKVHTHPVKAEVDPLVALKRQVSGLEADLASLYREVAKNEVASEGSGAVTKDARWPCSKCGSLLGFYDPDQDVLRTRYKDHTVYVHLGDGGWVTVLCRSCGELNTQSYVPVAGEAG